MKKAISKNRILAVEILSVLLLVFFVHNGISNFVNIQSLTNLLAFYTVHTNSVAWMIVLAQAVVVILLLFPKTRIWGFGAVILVALTAGYVVIANPHVPYHFGPLVMDFSVKEHIFFYSLLILISITGILLLTSRHKLKQAEAPPVIFT